MVQHPHHVHPLTPLITYSNEHFTPGNPPPHLQTDVDPKTGKDEVFFHCMHVCLTGMWTFLFKIEFSNMLLDSCKKKHHWKTVQCVLKVSELNFEHPNTVQKHSLRSQKQLSLDKAS